MLGELFNKISLKIKQPEGSGVAPTRGADENDGGPKKKTGDGSFRFLSLSLSFFRLKQQPGNDTAAPHATPTYGG